MDGWKGLPERERKEKVGIGSIIRKGKKREGRDRKYYQKGKEKRR